MAYKVFSNGDALTGGELNTFLMNQSVITFASVAARNAALPAPIEGQLVWLDDANKYVSYNGSAWVDLITPASSGNAIINGAFDIWQRGSTFSSAGFTADRWKLDFGGSGASATATRQEFTPATAPLATEKAPYFIQIATTSGSDAGSYITFEQSIEDIRSFAGKTITVSFWAKANSGTPKLGLEGIQTPSTGSPVFGINSTTVTLSTSWARHSFTFAVPSLTMSFADAGAPSAGNKFTLNFWMSNGSTLSTRSGNPGLQSNTFQFWGFQVDTGTTATPFSRNANSIQGELAACQRYFLRTNPGSSAPQGVGMFYASTTFIVHQFLKQSMRTAPTLTVNNAANFTVFSNGSARGVTSIAADVANTDVFSLAVTTSSSGTSGHAGALNASNINATFDFSAEL